MTWYRKFTHKTLEGTFQFHKMRTTLKMCTMNSGTPSINRHKVSTHVCNGTLLIFSKFDNCNVYFEKTLSSFDFPFKTWERFFKKVKIATHRDTEKTSFIFLSKIPIYEITLSRTNHCICIVIKTIVNSVKSYTRTLKSVGFFKIKKCILCFKKLIN